LSSFRSTTPPRSLHIAAALLDLGQCSEALCILLVFVLIPTTKEVDAYLFWIRVRRPREKKEKKPRVPSILMDVAAVVQPQPLYGSTPGGPRRSSAPTVAHPSSMNTTRRPRWPRRAPDYASAHGGAGGAALGGWCNSPSPGPASDVAQHSSRTVGGHEIHSFPSGIACQRYQARGSR
jgi:hypothetical protein